MAKLLLTPPSGNTKIAKNAVPTWSLNLAPHSSAGVVKPDGRIANLCLKSTKECRATCLQHAGRNGMDHATKARQWKTEMYVTQPHEFRVKMIRELSRLPGGSGVRLNALSDIIWEKEWPALFTMFPDLQFYDYTKIWKRRHAVLPPNYDLTFSVGEGQILAECWTQALIDGLRIAAVVAPTSLTWNWMNHISGVVDGDEHDWRPGDPKPGIVLLRPKGLARKLKPSHLGFVKP